MSPAAAGGRLGIRAYSRHRGCTHHAVQKAITAGRLSEKTRGNPHGSFVRNARGHAQIDPAAADREWLSNTDELQQRENHRQAPEPSNSQEAPANGQLFPGSEEELEEPVGPQKPRQPTLATAQAVRTTYLAQIAKLEYEERLGTLVRADAVRLSTFNAFRGARDKLMGIPDRVGVELAAISDAHELRERLRKEIRESLEALSHADA